MWPDVVAGYLNFCLGRLAETRQWHQDVAVALHEIMFLGDVATFAQLRCCDVKNRILITSQSSQSLSAPSWFADVSEMKYNDTSRHSMAFSSSLFPYFRDADGQPLTARDEWGHPPLKAGSSGAAVQPGASGPHEIRSSLIIWILVRNNGPRFA